MEQTNRTKELGTAPISSLLLKYAIPAVIAMAASSLYNIVDRIFIGHIPDVGTLSLGGLAVTFPVMNLAAAFGAMVGVGGSTLMSIKLGQRDYESAKRVLGNIVSLNIIMGILVSVVALIFIHPLLTFFGASETFVISDGKIQIGSVGSIWFIDWDQNRVRDRKCHVQIIGE